jgi:cytidylate kinase
MSQFTYMTYRDCTIQIWHDADMLIDQWNFTVSRKVDKATYQIDGTMRERTARNVYRHIRYNIDNNELYRKTLYLDTSPADGG